MTLEDIFAIATGNRARVPDDWMPATGLRPFIFDDPSLIWLEYHGKSQGFEPDDSQYAFGAFIAEKAAQFEKKWISEVAPEAVRVCKSPIEVRSAENVRLTATLMDASTPVIYQPALWWAPERIYGVPDLIIHTGWLSERFPQLSERYERESVPTILPTQRKPGHYAVFDCKFTTKLTESDKAKDLAVYTAQVMLYSYMLGQIQGLMPRQALLITRDSVFAPIPIGVPSQIDEPLRSDLRDMRDKYIEIKVNGAKYVPWKDALVISNLAHDDERWHTAKNVIATQKVPGKDPALIYQIGPGAKAQLAEIGFDSVQALLNVDPSKILLEKCKGVGPAKSKQIRSILEANRSGMPVQPPAAEVPPPMAHEFYVDFEYFTNVDVDFDHQWPGLEGCEMIFMVGVGEEKDGSWQFQVFVAEAEDQQKELEVFETFIDFLNERTGGTFADPATTALFHWSNAEVWQARRASDRHQLAADHPLRKLAWQDLQKLFLSGPFALPGAWGYGLKEFSRALGNVDPAYAVEWPEPLGEGLRAMVMGWKAYRLKEPLQTTEMGLLKQYLEADCLALCKTLKWARDSKDEE